MTDKSIAMETRARAEERLYSPSAARNREPILQVSRDMLPASGRALEIASGTGEHITFFARQLVGWQWMPSDPDATSRRSIAAWTIAEDLLNLAPPREIRLSVR